MDLPRVLIVSTSSVDNAKNIATEMGSEIIAESENFHYYLWTIDNKYYTAKVFLFVTDSSPMDVSTCNIEAIVLHHDPKADRDTKALDSYLPLVRSLSKADVFLLACQSSEDSKTKEVVNEWSQMHNFEMVEMERPHPADIIDEETEENVYGIERIVEALHTHLWPNRILKGVPKITVLKFPSLERNETDLPTSKEESSANINIVEDQLESMRLNTGARENSDQLLMESVLDGIMGEENADFGELFGRLMDMKEHAASLPSNDRRAAAEQLVTTFWKAMGGDPSEIKDLDE